MHIDPNLQRLQALIEHKRASGVAGTAGEQAPGRVGRSGNPRFAAAAERARQAVGQRGGQPATSRGAVGSGGQHGDFAPSSRKVEDRPAPAEGAGAARTDAAEPSGEAIRAQAVDAVRNARERLTLPARGGHLEDAQGPAPGRVGVAHLGRNFDRYA